MSPPQTPQGAVTPVFVQRNAAGLIVGLTLHPLTPQEQAAGRWEAATLQQPDVQTFQRQLGHGTPDNPLADTDASLARVTEDLIDVLIDRGLIQFTDLPQGAQEKLLRRRQTRERWANRLNLLGEDDVI